MAVSRTWSSPAILILSLIYLATSPSMVGAVSSISRVERSARPQLFYSDTSPEEGGKIPESALLRVELNKIDSIGLGDPHAQQVSAALVNTPLPERVDPHGSYPPSHGHSHHGAPHGGVPGGFGGFSAGFGADPYGKHPHHEPEPYHDPYHQPEPHHDPYHHPEPHHDPYHPEPHHDPYHPEPHHGGYHEPEPYHPDPYHAPHSDYHEPEPYHPPKPKHPVLLEKRPYEVKEIKALPVALHDTYTNFDCRKAPYPDRHYADPESGCQIYHFCHADGRQETFKCGYGTIFNEYLGTCDHTEAVYCRSGEGYAPVEHKPPHGYPHPEPHHDPYHHEPHHGGYHAEPHGYHGHRRNYSPAPTAAAAAYSPTPAPQGYGFSPTPAPYVAGGGGSSSAGFGGYFDFPKKAPGGFGSPF